MTPEGWKKAPVATFGEVVAGKAKNTAGIGENRPYLRVANVFDGRIDVRDVLEMPFSDEEFTRYRLEHGDVLLNEGQSLELVGRCAMYRGEYPGPCAIQNALVRFRAGPHASPAFAEQLFRWCQRAGVFAAIATQTTSIAHLGVKRLADLELLFPPVGEQRKIATILSSVDDAIEATQAVIEQLQVVKKAMMAELLTRGLPGRHTRFKMTEIGEVPEEWEVVALSSVGHLQTGLAKGKAVEGGVELPYLRVANVQDGHVDLSEVKTIRVDERSVERYRLRAGDVLFTEGGDADKLGRGCVWRGQIDPCLHQNHVFAVRTQPERLMPEFLSYWAASPRGKAYFLDCAKQTTNLASINSTQLKALPVPLPDAGEQVAIVDALQTLEARLAAERAVAQGATAVKTTLMSVLLTGEVRVKPDEAA